MRAKEKAPPGIPAPATPTSTSPHHRGKRKYPQRIGQEIQQLYTTTTTEGTKRYKCPVHHGKNLSVAVWWNNGPRAYCHSHQCSQSDILAALGITNSQSRPWIPPPAPRPRPTISVDYLPPVSPNAGVQYLEGILRPSGSSIQYQRDDGQRGRHWRSDTKRRNPGVIGDGWQCRRFDPIDPLAAAAICLAEGEKDAAILAAAGLIAFTAPRGAQSLPLADFTELVDLAKATGLPVFLAGDNLEIMDLQGLIRNNLSDRDPRWQKPIRSRAQYLEFKCPRPKRNIKRRSGPRSNAESSAPAEKRLPP